jgi:hypothetical protein
MEKTNPPDATARVVDRPLQRAIHTYVGFAEPGGIRRVVVVSLLAVHSSQFTVGHPHQQVVSREHAENGERRTENGERRTENSRSLFANPPSPSAAIQRCELSRTRLGRVSLKTGERCFSLVSARNAWWTCIFGHSPRSGIAAEPGVNPFVVGSSPTPGAL